MPEERPGAELNEAREMPENTVNGGGTETRSHGDQPLIEVERRVEAVIGGT
jgi:hypothetical protein